MKAVTITVCGQSPLLMHRFPMEPVQSIEKLAPEEQAELAAYRIPGSGNLYVPGVNMWSSIVEGAAYVKGKGRASMQKPAAACILVTPEYLDLGTKAYEIDARPVVVPATKGRVVRYRPRLNDWKLTMQVEWDPTLISDVQLRQIMDHAGQRVGVGDFRPQKKGPFGRFVVEHWERL